MAQINYRLPIFGDQKIQLRAESAQLFKWLEQHNEIRRMMNMDQLGVLKRRFSCAHHSKFEYVIMLLYLIEMIKQDEGFKYKYNLSRPYEEKGRRILSSISELLKCWALLLPTGHLHATFPHERAVLRILNIKKEFCDSFLARFDSYPSIQNQVKDIIKNDDYYKLHQVFVVLKLHDYKTSKSRKDITKHDRAVINKYIRYIDYYINPTKNVFKRAKNIFSDLRKIAYVLLDSYYCNLLFSFNTSHISQETIKASLRKDDADNYVSDLWNSLDNFLIKELYKNTQCLFIENLAYRAFFTRLHREKKNLHFLIDLLWQQDSSYIEKTFNDYLSKHKINLHQDYEYREMLNLSTTGLRFFDMETHLDESRRAINSNSKNAYLNFVVDKNIKTHSNDIYIYLKDRKRIKSSLQITNYLITLCIKLCIASQKNVEKMVPPYIRRFFMGRYGPFGAYYSMIGARNWNKLILFTLGLTIKTKYILRPVPIDKKMKLDALLLDQKIINEFNKYTNAKDRNQELDDLLQLASEVYKKNKQQHLKSKVIIYPFNVKIRTKDNKVEKGDIDSILLNFISNKTIELYMLQSKVKGQHYSDSKKQAALIKSILIGRLNKKARSNIFRLSTKSKTSVLKVILN